MEASALSIQALVGEIKKEIFKELENVECSLVSPSAYDTAWLAMIPDQNNPNDPMFKSCLKWIVENQKDGGFWGETNEEGLPTIDALPATLACMLALTKWNTGQPNILSGLNFIHAKAEILVKQNYQNLPRWFVLTFPAMIELAESAGLQLVFPNGLISAIGNIFVKRQNVLQTELELVEKDYYFPPLLVSYLETLPATYDLDSCAKIVKQYLGPDGSLFQSPAATAQAFMSTGNSQCLQYLHSILLKFPNGVPAKYPMDGDLIKLCMVDQVQGLGLAEFFDHEIKEMLAQIYRNEKSGKSNPKKTINVVPIKLFKDAMSFRLLRMYGHDVNPGRLCWFLHDPKTVSYIEENCEQFITAMYNVYRATDFVFPGEHELEEARTFATKILESSMTRNRDHNNLFISKGLQNMIKYELSVPWTARLDRLYHRKWIEENKTSPLWIGTASFYRLSCLDNEKLMQLAVENFEFRQSIYVQELEELKGWSKKWRLSEMGFGREKTVYTYFAVASSSCLPYNSIMRLAIAKAAIIVTVADDFYDMEGSLHELEILTDAVIRWDGEGLKGHSKTIFEALHDFVDSIAPQQGSIAVTIFQEIWRETFMAWMVERRWSLTGHIPSMDEYLEIGMTSIAAHTVALPATTFFAQSSSSQYHNITRLLMAIARMVNDTQSYQKEEEDGKMNLVSLHSKENPDLSVQESVAYVKRILEEKRKEFMQCVFSYDEDGMPESSKKIHLSCMKAFQMFFNSGNHFDSETDLLDDIQKSIYLPIDRRTPKPESFSKPIPISLPNSQVEKKKKKQTSKISIHFHPILSNTSFVKRPYVNSVHVVPEKVHVPMKFNLSFIGL